MVLQLANILLAFSQNQVQGLLTIHLCVVTQKTDSIALMLILFVAEECTYVQVQVLVCKKIRLSLFGITIGQCPFGLQ